MSESRREFLKVMMGSVAAATGAGALSISKLATDAAGEAQAATDSRVALPNVLLMVNDEERHWDMVENIIARTLLGTSEDPAPGTFRSLIPARMRLRNNGVRFSNYYTATAPCSPARGVMYTGHHAPDTQVVENMDYDTQASLRADTPTMADVLANAGYYCAYKGKVHLAHDSDLVTADDMLKLYGFHDWQGPYRVTDSEGPLSGAKRDDNIADFAAGWLETKARKTNAMGRPWLLAVNFINPHDVMLVDIDGSGTVQLAQGEVGKGFPLAEVPARHPYYFWWNPIKPGNFQGKNGYTVDSSGPRPQALDENASLLSAAFGNIPASSQKKTSVTVYIDNAQPDLGTRQISVPLWQAYLNYYMNCIIDNDMAMNTVLNALTENGLQDRTIVIYTADHGELAMSHMGKSRYFDEAAKQGYQPPNPETQQVMPLRQKGPYAYEENSNVPFVVACLSSQAGSIASTHVPHKNRDVPALASSVDLLPTLLAWAGKDSSWYKAQFGNTLGNLKMRTSLPGVSLANVVKAPTDFDSPQWHDGASGRDSVLLTADTTFMLDADIAYLVLWNKCNGEKIDTTKRGILRACFDGRYKYARYFSPQDYALNGPEYADLDYQGLIALGANGQDIQLFDHETQPFETFNIAEVDPETVRTLNNTLYAAMDRELYSTVRTPDTVQKVLDGEASPCG